MVKFNIIKFLNNDSKPNNKLFGNNDLNALIFGVILLQVVIIFCANLCIMLFGDLSKPHIGFTVCGLIEGFFICILIVGMICRYVLNNFLKNLKMPIQFFTTISIFILFSTVLIGFYIKAIPFIGSIFYNIDSISIRLN
jgi:hypothetical protein